MHNIQIIRTVQDAEKALSHLTRQKFAKELGAIRQAAQSMSNQQAGLPGRELAIRVILISFSDNVESMGDLA